MGDGGDPRALLERIDDPVGLLVSFFAAAPVGFQIYDAAGRSLLVNDAFRALFGGEPGPDYCLFDDPQLAGAEMLELIRRAFAGEPVQVPRHWYDTSAHVAAGRRVALEVTMTPLRDRDGRVGHVALTFEDVSADMQVAEERDRLDALLRNSIDVITLSDREGNVVWASPSVERVFGYTVEEQLRTHPAELLHPDDLDRCRALFEQAVATPGAMVEAEYRVRGKDGVYRWMEATAVNLLDHPSVRAVVCNQHDVTAARRAADELRASEVRFRGLIANSADLFELSSAAGRILYASPSALHVLGRRADQLIGGGLFDHVHPDDRAAAEEGLAECLRRGGAPLRQELRYRHAEGAWRTLEVIRVSRLADVALGGVLSTYRDVTELRALERQVTQAQKLEAAGLLAGGVAHDFNNMLTAILGFAGVIDRKLPPGDRLRTDVAQIIGAAERAAGLTNQLLAFGRKQERQVQLVSLSEQVRGLELMLRRLIGDDIELHLALCSKPTRIKADPGQLEQVVVNLVVNARDALPAGGTITIETAEVHLDEEFARCHLGVEPGPHVLLAVSDTGEGVPPEHQPRVFEPFFTTKHARGSGLGLATVYGIVTQSGGHIWLDSEPGRGASFRLYFPAALSPAGS